MADEEIGHAEAPLQVLQQVDDLGRDRDVERRDRLVADEQLRAEDQRPGNHDALALPAGELMRIAPEQVRTQADCLEQLERLLPASLGSGFEPVDDERLDDLLADGQAPVERRERVLMHQLHPPAQGSPLAIARRADGLAREHDPPARRRQQAEHEARGGRLAATGFADQAEGLAGGEGKADAVDGMEQSLLPTRRGDRIMPGEIVDAKQRVHAKAPTGAVAAAAGAIAVSERRRQAARWSCAASISAGVCVRHASIASEQRGAKAHPGGILSGAGTVPAIGVSR